MLRTLLIDFNNPRSSIFSFQTQWFLVISPTVVKFTLASLKIRLLA